MLVGVCCECQNFSPCGSKIQDPSQPCCSVPKGGIASGSDQMPEGVQVLIGNDLTIVKDQGPSIEEFLNGTAVQFGGKIHRIQEDQFEQEEREREQAKEAEKLVCCADKFCNHRPDPPKPAGMFGTIGDILLAAKNGKQKTKKKG